MLLEVSVFHGQLEWRLWISTSWCVFFSIANVICYIIIIQRLVYRKIKLYISI